MNSGTAKKLKKQIYGDMATVNLGKYEKKVSRIYDWHTSTTLINACPFRKAYQAAKKEYKTTHKGEET